jgi:ribonucleotide monophosphatase NagD (HAD superfamily)
LTPIPFSPPVIIDVEIGFERDINVNKSSSKKDIYLVVFDIDGVLLEGDQVLPGAIDTIRKLHQKGCRLHFLTNSSSRSRKEHVNRLLDIGFGREGGEWFTFDDIQNDSVNERKKYLLFLDNPEDESNPHFVAPVKNLKKYGFEADPYLSDKYTSVFVYKNSQPSYNDMDGPKKGED